MMWFLGYDVELSRMPRTAIECLSVSAANADRETQAESGPISASGAQLGLLTGLDGYYAWNGEGPFADDGPQTDLRSLTVLWRKAEHFVVKRQYAKTGTIEDMKGLQGKKVSMGLEGSGPIGGNRFLRGNLGIDIDRDMDLVYLGFDASARALQKGEIEAISMASGAPVSAVTLALSALGDALVILDVTDRQMETVDGGLGLWTRYVIEAGTYLKIIRKALSDMSLDRALTGL